jgi:hypothetical protein
MCITTKQAFCAEKIKTLQFKDEVLDYISSAFNVAQFASFGPYDLSPRYARIFGAQPNVHFPAALETLSALISNSQEKSVNVRCFKPGIPKGNPFYYGIKDAGEAYALLQKCAAGGYYTIVNETIDICDGGVSGVAMNDIVEFSPNDTPKCVEKPGLCSLPRSIGLSLLSKVYGFAPELGFQDNYRVEFSIHPKRRGFRREHTIIWEVEPAVDYSTNFSAAWPNNFSRFIGDKAFGLLIAEGYGALVPKTTVIARNMAPFCFGKETGLSEIWLRTCPAEKTPGKFPTYFGWHDPFKLMASEDPMLCISSVLSQHSVASVYSGAAAPSAGGLIIEGTEGCGDNFMIGLDAPAELPLVLRQAVEDTYRCLVRQLGPVTFEWAYDGRNIWIVQLSKSPVLPGAKIIYPGEPEKYTVFDIKNGLEALRELAGAIAPGQGIELVGNIGITSHFGDILRNARIPSKLSGA